MPTSYGRLLISATRTTHYTLPACEKVPEFLAVFAFDADVYFLQIQQPSGLGTARIEDASTTTTNLASFILPCMKHEVSDCHYVQSC